MAMLPTTNIDEAAGALNRAAQLDDTRKPLETEDLGGGRRSDKMRWWRQCPECGENTVDLVDGIDHSDDMESLCYVAECRHCGWKGEVWFDVEYCDHVTDPTFAEEYDW